MSYTTTDDIPIHCFSNKECTKTPNPDLIKYLRYMAKNHPNDLEYLWRYTQQYTQYGGMYILQFEKWLEKLNRDLNKQD